MALTVRTLRRDLTCVFHLRLLPSPSRQSWLNAQSDGGTRIVRAGDAFQASLAMSRRVPNSRQMEGRSNPNLARPEHRLRMIDAGMEKNWLASAVE
jgi:hypothetical protein